MYVYIFFIFNFFFKLKYQDIEQDSSLLNYASTLNYIRYVPHKNAMKVEPNITLNVIKHISFSTAYQFISFENKIFTILIRYI